MKAEISVMPVLKPHWSERLETISVQLRKQERILLASDFDGTLAPIVSRPSEASMPENTMTVLTRLAGFSPRVRLAFLSGRELSDLRSRVGGIPSAVLAGNHGLEISSGDSDWIHPSVAGIRSRLDELLGILESRFAGVPGVELEDKGFSLTLHYRRVDPETCRLLLSAIESMQLPDAIRRHDGKMVVEFRPEIHWNKGAALRKIARDLGIACEAVIYLGDDITDEDAFQELGNRGVSIHVGGAANWSSASLHATDPADVALFLGKLVEITGC